VSSISFSSLPDDVIRIVIKTSSPQACAQLSQVNRQMHTLVQGEAETSLVKRREYSHVRLMEEMGCLANTSTLEKLSLINRLLYDSISTLNNLSHTNPSSYSSLQMFAPAPKCYQELNTLSHENFEKFHELELSNKARAFEEHKQNLGLDQTLKLAVDLNYWQIVGDLAKSGANINHTEAHHSSYLHNAAKTGSIHMVHVLIQNGANVNALDPNGETVLHTACSDGNLNVVEYLLRLNPQPDVNATCSFGSTPLIGAIVKKSLPIVRYLLAHRADPNKRGGNQATPLYYAARTKNVDIVRCLVENDADVHAINSNQTLQ
jgi:ankyrin repeat protein